MPGAHCPGPAHPGIVNGDEVGPVHLRDAHKYRIDWLISFAAVAEHGGFSAAAKALYRSQSRVSTHVADLEQALGARLFDRSAHPPQLTPEGRVLRKNLEEILRRLDALGNVSSGSAPPTGQVLVGCYPSVAAYLFPQAVLRLRRSTPGISLVLHEGHADDLDAALVAGDVDLVVRPTLPVIGEGTFMHRVLWREPLVAVVNRAHPMAGATGVRLRQIAEQPLITMGWKKGGRARQLETNLAFANAGLSPTIVYQTHHPQTLVSLVRHGLGVALVNSLAATTSNLDGVSLVPVADTECDRVVAVWWRADHPRSAAIEAVRDAMLAVPPPRFSRGERTRVPEPPGLQPVDSAALLASSPD